MRRDEPGDEELIARIGLSDSSAMRLLYARHGRTVFGVALRIIGEPSAAEEVAQDVFVRVWQKAGTYRAEKAKVATWLARIARNRAIDALRARRSRELLPSRAGKEQEASESMTDPLDAAWASMRDERVRDAVAALPPEQRRALSLAFFQGLTHREIAESLGEPLGTVKSRVREAMRKLRTILEGDA